MISFESIMSIDKDSLQKAAGDLSHDDIAQLVEWLTLKDDKIRYQAFLLLHHRSSLSGEILDKKSKREIETLL